MRARGRWYPILVVSVAVAVLLFGSGVGLWHWLTADLPALGEVPDLSTAPSSQVLDRHGRFLFEFLPPHTGRHDPVPLERIPQALQQATIATEDVSYYANPGVDALAIVRAMWINLRGGEVLAGGSTLTQQVARNLLLGPEERTERTLRRKLREAILAWRLARHTSKDEILALYLNETYYGNLAYGVEAAAQAYFAKSVDELDLAECALLAGLPQAPALYNPLENLDAARQRQAVVLDLMVKAAFVSPEEARLAKAEPLHFASVPFPIRAPHFVMYVRGELERALGLERLEAGGLRIYTTLDLDLNESGRDVIRHQLALLAACQAGADAGSGLGCPPGGHNVRNAAAVALDPQTGEILAMVGSPDYFSARIDGAVNGTTALRQPGSSIKPLTYAAAFASGRFTPATMMLDIRTTFSTREGMPYVPLNYDRTFHGPVRLREALASSYNLVAVKVLDEVGLVSMLNLARRVGITTFDQSELASRFGLALTLGGGEVRLLELSAAYAAFANGGQQVTPVAIQRVEDRTGQVVWEGSPGLGEQVLEPRVAYLISDVLSDDMARIPGFGEGSVLKLGHAAVKTGTTSDFRDNWAVGYTPDLVVGVWVGNADNEPMRDVSGVEGAAPIWHSLMSLSLRGRPALGFQRPDGLVDVEVCALSGLLPTDHCPHRITETFLAGTEPTQSCDLHQAVEIDARTGLRATTDTPLEHLVTRVFTVWPAEAHEWALEHGLELPPALVEARQLASSAGHQRTVSAGTPLVVTSPDAGTVYRLDPAQPRDAQKIVIGVRPGEGITPAEVTILADGIPLGTLARPPYQVLWRLEPGEHTFSAVGTGVDGEHLSSDQVRVAVQAP
jgi:1A family penicillin-binding protein